MAAQYRRAPWRSQGRRGENIVAGGAQWILTGSQPASNHQSLRWLSTKSRAASVPRFPALKIPWLLRTTSQVGWYHGGVKKRGGVKFLKALCPNSVIRHVWLLSEGRCAIVRFCGCTNLLPDYVLNQIAPISVGIPEREGRVCRLSSRLFLWLSGC